MATERRYYDDSYTTQFRAPIVRRREIDGRPAVELAITYFYPESGGQEADRGTLGPWKVVDVQAGDDDGVWHTVSDRAADAAASDGGEEPLEAGSVIEGHIVRFATTKAIELAKQDPKATLAKARELRAKEDRERAEKAPAPKPAGG